MCLHNYNINTSATINILLISKTFHELIDVIIAWHVFYTTLMFVDLNKMKESVIEIKIGIGESFKANLSKTSNKLKLKYYNAPKMFPLVILLLLGRQIKNI